MKKIILSLATIVLALTTVVGATYGVFSSQAEVTGNTFATGILEIRVRGGGQTGSSIAGFTFSNAAPGDCVSGQFAVLNFNASNFGGPSTLPAKELVISASYSGGNVALYNALRVTIEANRGWPSKMMVYNDGKLKNLSEADLFSPRWNELAAGHSEDVYYNVCLPTSASDSLQGRSTTFDFVVDAYNPHR